MTAEDIEIVTDGLAPVRRELFQKRDLRIAALEAKIALLEKRPALKWAGIWAPGGYDACSLCTRSGSLWLSTEATMQQPGEGPHWRLIVKKGQAE